ncbi:hypothetical protein ACHBTE_02950 [Streptomyces sp. M41]|uniref:hypothetical protein n=1 Tax=Streptomyces sp. M41 TaxID=3059412 RepID=UPI00374D7637
MRHRRCALGLAVPAVPLLVLICDEVTSGLDAVTRRGILDVLAGRVGAGDDLSLVLITHDLDAARPAHRIAVLDAGGLVEQGPAHQILTAPRHPFTISLVETTERPAAGSGVGPGGL